MGCLAGFSGQKFHHQSVQEICNRRILIFQPALKQGFAGFNALKVE
jgi:hypothetical protein